MNMTISSAAINTWKRIKLQYATGVCGIALALGVAVSLGGWETGDASRDPGLNVHVVDLRGQTANPGASSALVVQQSVRPTFNNESAAEYAAREAAAIAAVAGP